MTSFFEGVICIEEQGPSFKDLIRPNLKNICPTGTLKCSPHTSVDNSICMKNINDCPITFL